MENGGTIGPPAARTWWKKFGDSELDRLEELTTTNNQELAAAAARFAR